MVRGTDVTSTLASNRLPFCVYTLASLVLLMGEKLVQRWREVSWFKPESAAEPICFLKRIMLLLPVRVK